MKRVSKTNPMEKCKDIDTFDFKPWKENKMTKVNVSDEGKMNVKVIKH